jgi:hypothetical protein
VAKRRQEEDAEETTGVPGKGAKAVPGPEDLPVRFPFWTFLYSMMLIANIVIPSVMMECCQKME